MHIDTRRTPTTFKGQVSDWPVTATGWPVELKRPPEKPRQDPEAVASGRWAAPRDLSRPTMTEAPRAMAASDGASGGGCQTGRWCRD